SLTSPPPTFTFFPYTTLFRSKHHLLVPVQDGFHSGYKFETARQMFHHSLMDQRDKSYTPNETLPSDRLMDRDHHSFRSLLQYFWQWTLLFGHFLVLNNIDNIH